MAVSLRGGGGTLGEEKNNFYGDFFNLLKKFWVALSSRGARLNGTFIKIFYAASLMH